MLVSLADDDNVYKDDMREAVSIEDTALLCVGRSTNCTCGGDGGRGWQGRHEGGGED